MEAVLLATGLIMTALSSTVLVSDTDWSISAARLARLGPGSSACLFGFRHVFQEWTECALLISIGTLATSIIGGVG